MGQTKARGEGLDWWTGGLMREAAAGFGVGDAALARFLDYLERGAVDDPAVLVREEAFGVGEHKKMFWLDLLGFTWMNLDGCFLTANREWTRMHANSRRQSDQPETGIREAWQGWSFRIYFSLHPVWADKACPKLDKACPS
jgi:hypothetical protein